MPYIATCEAPISIEGLAMAVTRSSNFRFSWQFYHWDGIDPRSPTAARLMLDRIIDDPALHEFLRASFSPLYGAAFEIRPIHAHCHVASADGAFENTLARAAGDHLGAYSRDLRDASLDELAFVQGLFRSVGPYPAHELLPGDMPGCATCASHNNHLFSTWFYDVAWDWCFLVMWPDARLLWLGCLTDTD